MKLDSAVNAWVPLRRAKVHGPHGEVTGHRVIRDHKALRPLRAMPSAVTQRHLSYVGTDCLVTFDANLYSAPARRVRPRQLADIRATKPQITLHSTAPDTREAQLRVACDSAPTSALRFRHEIWGPTRGGLVQPG
ncbi:hypothetical protein GCM10010449_39470 [Streptomyces rectiviolaceus]|uniref:Transposase n=1 Tax=Streptomyces rectiviolaceus TaxID=332591 RepID=A0ABP6MIA8_9ACTN